MIHFNNIKTYTQLLNYIDNTHTNKHYLNYIKNDTYHSISTEEFIESVHYVKYGLKEIGIQQYDSVGIYASSSPQWIIVDFALQQLGAISIPIFSNISVKNLEYQIKDANINHIFIANNDLPSHLYTQLTTITTQNSNSNATHTLNSVYDKGKKSVKATEQPLKETMVDIHEDDIFSIIYTSGSTGVPKGVELTHKNVISQLRAIGQRFDITNQDKALSLLPLAHIFERVVVSFYLVCGVNIYFLDEIDNLTKRIQQIKPTLMSVVPRVLDKIFTKIEIGISQQKGVKQFIAQKAFNHALSNQLSSKGLFYYFYHALIYKKLQKIFGGNLKFLICGGAMLNKEIQGFFTYIGIPIYQGYGLTEFSPVVSVNSPSQNKLGTVGCPLNGVEVKLAVDEELLVRGPSIMKGYRNQPSLTHDIIDKEGWLHTGDLASIDEQGFISIYSRKKELFKTSTGKYVSGVAIEQALCRSSFIDFAVVVANDRPYVTALLFVNINDPYELYRKKYNTPSLTKEEFYTLDWVKQTLDTHINSINCYINQWEEVIHYTIITNPLEISNGELTPSMKLCRNVIEQRYQAQIDAMYQTPKQGAER